MLNRKDEIIVFLKDQLTLFHPRDDYKEMILLALAFLGELKNFKIYSPGAIHRARWTCKIIMYFKVFLLRKQLNIEKSIYMALENF